MRSLLDEMDALTDELGWSPPADRGALEVEFRRLQKAREPELTAEQWKDLFSLWCDHYDGREHVKRGERNTQVEALMEERSHLLIARRFRGAHAAGVNARLNEIGLEMARLVMPREYRGPLGTWPDA